VGAVSRVGAAGATLREMTDQMGHSSPRAALIYMHGNDGRQRKIADSLNKLVQSELSRNGQRSKDGTRRKPSDAPMFVKAG
jgi:chemotaxis response regulator CheB